MGRGGSNCYLILSSVDCYFGQLLGTPINTQPTFIECQRGLWTLFDFDPLSPAMSECDLLPHYGNLK